MISPPERGDNIYNPKFNRIFMAKETEETTEQAEFVKTEEKVKKIIEERCYTFSRLEIHLDNDRQTYVGRLRGDRKVELVYGKQPEADPFSGIYEFIELEGLHSALINCGIKVIDLIDEDLFTVVDRADLTEYLAEDGRRLTNLARRIEKMKTIYLPDKA